MGAALSRVPMQERVLGLLNGALELELASLFRCKRRYYLLDDHLSREQLLEHTVVRSLHADRIAGRIIELGGSPDYSPKNLATEPDVDARAVAHAELAALEREVELHRELIGHIGAADPRTRAMLEEIVAEEQKLFETLRREPRGHA